MHLENTVKVRAKNWSVAGAFLAVMNQRFPQNREDFLVRCPPVIFSITSFYLLILLYSNFLSRRNN